MRFLSMRVVCFALAITCKVTSQAGEPVSAVSFCDSAPKRIEIPGVHNAFHVTDQVWSGSQPEGDKTFAALAKLGIKTIISVDGAKPDVEAARRHGLRYIHLPFGYDGVPANRVAELARAAGHDSSPVYVHCHHGLHRGPTAAAIICQSKANWTTNQAEAWMRDAGTASEYAGLYRSVATFKKPTPEELAAVKDLPEVAKSSSVVEAMVAIDEHFSRLKLSQKANWKTPPNHADITPEHEAMLLWEQLRELDQINDTASHSVDYRTKLGNAKEAVGSLRQSLMEVGTPAAIDQSFARVGDMCSACHKRFRNN